MNSKTLPARVIDLPEKDDETRYITVAAIESFRLVNTSGPHWVVEVVCANRTYTSEPMTLDDADALVIDLHRAVRGEA